MLENLTTNKFSNLNLVQSDRDCSCVLLPRNCTSMVKCFKNGFFDKFARNGNISTILQLSFILGLLKGFVLTLNL